MIKVATTQFSLEKVKSPNNFWLRFERLVDEAQKSQAKAIVFPEYFSLSLMMCEEAGEKRLFKKVLHDSQKHSEALLIRAQKIAQEKKMAMVLGTLPWFEGNKRLNRSFMVNELGQVVYQDKIFMTRFEDEVWKIESGEPIVKTFMWQGLKCAILTCYDSEFAVLSQSLARAKVELLFVPSCTDTEHGYWRVRHSCEARAIENQLIVVMSSIVGGDRDHEEIDSHYGRGCVMGPCDTGFHANGVVGEGETNREGVTVVGLPLEALKMLRASGSVLNLRDAGKYSAVEHRDVSFGE